MPNSRIGTPFLEGVCCQVGSCLLGLYIMCEKKLVTLPLARNWGCLQGSVTPSRLSAVGSKVHITIEHAHRQISLPRAYVIDFYLKDCICCVVWCVFCAVQAEILIVHLRHHALGAAYGLGHATLLAHQVCSSSRALQ